MTARRNLYGVVAAVGVVALLAMSVARGTDDGDAAEAFDGYIQSGTCAAPTDDLRVDLESDRDHDVEPYVAKVADSDETIVLGHYGTTVAPGFGFAAVYTDQQFSLVVTDADSPVPVACGDILEPHADRFAEAGLAVVQLLPVDDSTVQGVALIQRTQLERELDVIPTRVRILLTADSEVTAPTQSTAGFEGYIVSGDCATPTDDLRVDLESHRDDYDVQPFLAKQEGSSAPVTVAYYGAPLAPGFGLASIYTDQRFSIVITDGDSGDPVACGDILEPDEDDFAEVGLALAQLLPIGDSGAQGFALVERLPLQRELDVTPTRVRIVLFAAPVAVQ